MTPTQLCVMRTCNDLLCRIARMCGARVPSSCATVEDLTIHAACARSLVANATCSTTCSTTLDAIPAMCSAQFAANTTW